MGLILIFTPIIWIMAVYVELFVAAMGLGGIAGGVIILFNIDKLKKRNILPVVSIIIGIVLIVIGLAFTVSAFVALVVTTRFCRDILVGIINY